MRLRLRHVFALAFLLTASCGKTLAPAIPRTTADGSRADAAAETRASAASLTAQLKVVGAIVTLDRHLEPRVRKNEAFYVAELALGETRTDTVPAYGTLKKIEWRHSARGQMDADDELQQVAGSAAAPTGKAEPPIGEVLAPGNHQFVFPAPPHAGRGEATFRLMAGFLPGAWWAGPDPDLWPVSSDGDGRAVDVVDWNTFTTVSAWPPDGRPYFGPDSLERIPSARRPPGDDFEARTFYEIYGDRIYARREGDTVHLNSWVVLVHGGYDKDSPYVPRVDASDPALPPDFAARLDRYPVLRSLGLVGSPIGFRTQLSIKLPDGTVFRLAATGLYPVFDPASVFRLPQLAGYVRAARSGTAYVVVRAQDSDGLQDPAILDPIGLVGLVDAGGGSPADRLARRRVLTFQVAAAPGISARAAGPVGH